MINELILSVAQKLVTANASWLSEVRTIGYMNRFEDGLVITDGENEIGITDRTGNSGYIRFVDGAQGFSVESIPSYRSCESSSRYSYRMRLVVVAKTETPENLSLLLSTQMNSFSFSGHDKGKARVTGGGTNSFQIVSAEGGEQLNTSYRALFIDFTLQFDWRNDCVPISITMECNNCDETIDYGCVKACSEIELPITITEAQTGTITTMFNGQMIVQPIELPVGEGVVVDLSGLNADYQYTIQVRGENGEALNIQPSPSLSYNCFKVKLIP